MRVDAAEFVPSQAYTWPPHQLSADSPEFVPASASTAARAEGTASLPTTGFESLDQVDSVTGYLTSSSPDILPADVPVVPQAGSLLPGLDDQYGGGPPGLIDALLGEEATFQCISSEDFLVPKPLPESAADEEGSLRIEGSRLHWDLPGGDRLLDVPKGESLRSPCFSAAGVASLQLAFFPKGTSLTGKGDCALALQCEDKTKLKFELFLNAKTSGSKVLLGKKFSCDFRQPDMGGDTHVVVSVQVHENLVYAGFM